MRNISEVPHSSAVG